MRRRANLTVFTTLLGFTWFVPTYASAAVVRCHGIAATVVGADRSEHLTGTAHRDVIAALGGNDTVDGLGGNDLICGGAGNDRLNGGHGEDVLYGGIDFVHETDEGTVEKIGDILDGGPGGDLLHPGKDVRPAEEVTPDAVSWATSPQAVHIDLAAGVATGEGHDRIFGDPGAVVGSGFGDVILEATQLIGSKQAGAPMRSTPAAATTS